MNKTTLVAFLLLLSNITFAATIKTEITHIESQWATIYYSKSDSQQKKAYPKLLNQTKKLLKLYPGSLELKIWQAIIIATNAAFESPFSALDSIDTAKRILESSIKKNPKALEGAALVTLGTLYYMSPGWPISFGNDLKAEQLLKKGLKINPNSIDANYFYADYLLSKNKTNKASKFFKKAINSPSRPKQKFADSQLKKEALIALKNVEQRKLESGKNKFMSLFTTAKSSQEQIKDIH